MTTPRLPSAAGAPRALALALLTLAALSPASLVAQDARAVRLGPGDELRLDGRVDEAFWARVTPIDDFRTREPVEGGVPSERTEVRIAWDDDALWVAISAFDREPDRVVARVRQRDQVMSARGFGGLSFAGDDAVALLFDPFDDDRNGIVLATNANGALFDALVTDEGAQVNVDWQGVWEVRGARTEEGWSAEFRIPWRSIRYPAGSDAAWGLNVYREIPRRQEEILWRSWEREGGGFDRVARAGSVGGLVGLPEPGANVEVKPFAVGGTRGRASVGGGLDYEGEFDMGVDLKAEVRPGLVLDLTANTDFAQVEVDDQQVNLTRFSLFFPERRDFFLENAGIFEFGRRGFGVPPFLMFFSRRIGIGSDGPVPILGGGRLTGRVGDQTVGLLSVATDEVDGMEREFFNVARVKRDFGESGYIGAMVTDRRGEGPANTVAGIDARILLHPTVETEAFAARSVTEGEGGEGWVWAANANWTTDLTGGFLSLLQVDEGMNARTGFVARTDFRKVQLNLRRSLRPELLGIRKIDFRVNNEWGWTTTGRFQEREYGPSMNVSFDSGDSFNLSWQGGESEVDEAFALAGLLDVPVGRYGVDGWSGRFNSSSARALRLGADWRRNEAWDGHITRWGVDLTWVPSPALTLAPEFSRNHVEIPAGEFTADITALRLTWAFSPLMTANAYIQHNGLTDEVVSNVRFNFIHRPGSDLFVVFSDERVETDDGWRTEDRGLLVKLTYLIRF